LLAVVSSLGDAPSARAACADAGVPEASLPAFEKALARLVETDMLRERAA
jgi:putative mycofactocin binding protein MftB